MSNVKPSVDLLVVGAGPTGLCAALDALRHGLSVRIIDRNERRTSYSKALVLHSRSMEVLDDLGCRERLLAAGREFRALNIIADGELIQRIDFRRLDWHDAPFPMWFTIPQSETERCIEEELEARGIGVERTKTLQSFRQENDGIEAEIVHADGSRETCRASWLIACDGARSDVRRLLDIELEGDVTGETFILADVALESELADAEGYNIFVPEGMLIFVPLEVPGRVRLIAHTPQFPPEATPKIDIPMLQEIVDKRSGFSARITELGWTSSFSPKHFVTKKLRVGRVFLAGDAAHIHSPVGGQGLNTGIQDVHNLIWKLALVHRGAGNPALLETYQMERHAVAEAMINNVRRATKMLTLRGAWSQQMRNRIASVLMQLSGVRDRLGSHVGMLHLRYEAGSAIHEPRSSFLHPGHPRAGERACRFAAFPALSKTLQGPKHTLLLFEGLHGQTSSARTQSVVEQARALGRDNVRIVRVRKCKDSVNDDAGGMVLADPLGEMHRAYGAVKSAVLWIRPDTYVGFRGTFQDLEALEQYLRAMFVPAVAPSSGA